MNFVAKCVGVALIGLALLVCSSNAKAQADRAAPAADPAVWGIYAQLVGTEWGGGGEKVDWRWGPDNTIVESRTLMMKTVIRPGPSLGELVSVYGGGLHTFDGRVSPDGSVLWIRRGRFVKMPSRVSIVEGRYREEMVKLDEAKQVAKVTLTTQFVQATGLPVGSKAALAVATAAPGAAVAPASRASTSAEPVMPPSSLAPVVGLASSASVTPAARPSFGVMDADEMVARVSRQAESVRQTRIQEQQAEARSTEERRLQLAANARQLANTQQPAGERRQQSAAQGSAAGQAPVAAAGGSLRVETTAEARARLPAALTASTPSPVPSQGGDTQKASYYYWVKEDDQNRTVMYVSEVVSLPYSTLEVQNRRYSPEAGKAWNDKCRAFLETIRSRHAGHVRWTQPCPEGFAIGAPKSVRGDNGPSIERSRAKEVEDMKRHFRVVEVKLPGN